MVLPAWSIFIRTLRNSSSTSCPPSGFSFNTVSPYSCPMVMSCLMGPGWFGTVISDVTLKSRLCTMRSPTGHFSLSSMALAGAVNLEVVFNLPDLLQPTPDRPKARMTMIGRTCFFMDDFFRLKFARESSRFDNACELQNDGKIITVPPAMRDGAVFVILCGRAGSLPGRSLAKPGPQPAAARWGHRALPVFLRKMVGTPRRGVRGRPGGPSLPIFRHRGVSRRGGRGPEDCRHRWRP